jgi:hypothetical protein
MVKNGLLYSRSARSRVTHGGVENEGPQPSQLGTYLIIVTLSPTSDGVVGLAISHVASIKLVMRMLS